MKTISLIILIVIPILCNSQDFKLKLIVTNAIGQNDSIFIGMYNSATLGIDTFLNEIDIYDTPFNSIDIRAIQRDSENWQCLNDIFTSPPPLIPIYSPYNIDSKIDLRPFDPIGYFNTISYNFEIFIHSNSYPVVITSDFTEIHNHYCEYYSSISLLDNTCESIENKPIYFQQVGDTLFTLPNSNFNTIIANIAHEVNVKEVENDTKINIFPNPINKESIIDLNNNYNSEIVISDVTGRNIYTMKFYGDHFPIGQLNLSSGIYYFNLINDNKCDKGKFIVK